MWKPLIRLRVKLWLRPKWWFKKKRKTARIVFPPRVRIIELKEEAEEQLIKAERLTDKAAITYNEGKLEILDSIIGYVKP